MHIAPKLVALYCIVLYCIVLYCIALYCILMLSSILCIIFIHVLCRECYNNYYNCYSSSSMLLDLSWDQDRRLLVSYSLDNGVLKAQRRWSAVYDDCWQALEQEACFASIYHRSQLRVGFQSPIETMSLIFLGYGPNSYFIFSIVTTTAESEIMCCSKDRIIVWDVIYK